MQSYPLVGLVQPGLYAVGTACPENRELSIEPRLNESHFAVSCYADWISFLHSVILNAHSFSEN